MRESPALGLGAHIPQMSRGTHWSPSQPLSPPASPVSESQIQHTCWGSLPICRLIWRPCLLPSSLNFPHSWGRGWAPSSLYPLTPLLSQAKEGQVVSRAVQETWDGDTQCQTSPTFLGAGVESALESLTGPGKHRSLPLCPLPTPAFLMHWVWVLIICMINKFPGDGGQRAMLRVTVEGKSIRAFYGFRTAMASVVRRVVISRGCLCCSVYRMLSYVLPRPSQAVGRRVLPLINCREGSSRQACELGSEPRRPRSQCLQSLSASQHFDFGVGLFCWCTFSGSSSSRDPGSGTKCSLARRIACWLQEVLQNPSSQALCFDR